MTGIRRTVHNIFVWSYERGTLQYDIICALILAFIFLVPPSCFVGKRTLKLAPSHQSSTISTQDLKTADSR